MNPNQQPPQPGQQLAYPDPQQSIGENLSVMQAGERVICQIKRHPIGIITNYVISGFVLIVIALLTFGLVPQLSTDDSSQTNMIAVVSFLFVAVIAALFNLIATKVYWGNRWVVTSDSITQIEQKGLFTTQSSQLSLANIEDVTAEQNGLLTHIFNFGVLKAETAGHRSKFVFLYCPNPNFYAQQILGAREEFEQQGGHAGVAATPPTGVNTGTNQ